MTHARAPYLGLFLSAPLISLAPAPIGADNIHARFALGYWVWGLSRDTTTKLSRPVSWILSRAINHLDPSTTPRQQNRPSRVCACARVRMCVRAMSWCRGVVSYLNSLKRKKESHYSGHDNATTVCRGLPNPLKNIKKGGFAHG